MIRAARLYLEYRRQGLRRAWIMSGMSAVAWAAGKAAALACAAAAFFAITSQAEAIHEAADNRVAARLAHQAGEIDELRNLLAACLGNKEGALWVGGELHLCRAVPTGVRQ